MTKMVLAPGVGSSTPSGKVLPVHLSPVKHGARWRVHDLRRQKTSDRNVGTLDGLASAVDTTRRFQPMSSRGRWPKKQRPGVIPRIG